MAAYIISTVLVTDPEKFAVYAKGIAGLSEKHGGEYIVRGQVSGALEGDVVVGERVVVAKFPSADAVRGYINSPEYQAAKTARDGAAIVSMRLIED
jgi:uncharacterized protein (DUF1330 family)